MMTRLLEYLHHQRVACKRLFFILLVLIPLLDFTVKRPEAHFFGDRIPCFWSLFGLAVCLMMIFVWKWLAHVWLERDETYYDC
ncbi:MAG: hypothetical protein HXX11_06595 [Desulfuromonadales bacterium]|nr:hypothetical protein [Desulfuromonadales bacterium]